MKDKNDKYDFTLKNPFTPMKAATSPQDFFGRKEEIQSLDRGLEAGHIAIQGGIGIGKTSLLEILRIREEGFDNKDSLAESYIVLGNRDVGNLDDAAKLLLQEFVQVDSIQKTKKLGISKIIAAEKSVTEIKTNFPVGRCLAVLKNIFLKWCTTNLEKKLILAFDEADKCPRFFAQLFRNITGYCDVNHISNIRLMVAGVNPYFQKMVDEDQGIRRFFTEVKTLKPLPEDEAEELLTEKFMIVSDQAKKVGLPLEIDPEVIGNIIRLSGGHPHLLQLLGYRIIENEISDADGTINNRDLIGSLRTICFEDRSDVYRSVVHYLDIENKLEPLKQLFNVVDVKCPTIITRDVALEITDRDTIQWFVDNNVLLPESGNSYRLEDEFLRIRIMFEEEELTQSAERRIIEDAEYYDPYDNPSIYDNDDPYDKVQ